MRRTMTLVFVIAALAGVALIAGYFFSGHEVPAGQPPLAELSHDALDSLKDDFNQSSDSVRIVLLLSPT
jgi:hypothetical protein